MSGSTGTIVPNMTAAGALTGAELFYAVQTGADRKVAASQILTYANANSLYQGPTLTTIGNNLTVVSGTLSVTGVVTSAVTNVATGAGLSGGPITTSGTLVADWHAGTVASLSGLTLSTGTLLADWRPGIVTSLSGLTLTSGTLAATGTGTVTQVVAGTGLNGGTITTSGTLSANWQLGTATTAGSGIALSDGTLSANWQLGTATTLAGGLSLSGGTLTATGASIWNAGTVTTLGPNLSLNSGTLVSDNFAGSISAAGSNQAGATTLTANVNVVTTAAASTGVRLASSPTAGFRQWVLNNGANILSVYPASGGTIDALAANAAASVVSSGRAWFIATTGSTWVSA